MKAKDLVLERLALAERDTKQRFKTFNECDAIFHGSGKTQFTSSQVFNPYSWANVETIVPRMVAQTPTVRYRPREPTDKDNSDLATSLFEYWWHHDGAFEKVISWVKNALVYGTGVMKVYWKSQKTEVKSYAYGEDGKPILGEDEEYETQTQEVSTYDDPCAEVVNAYDFFVDPNATDIQGAQWVIHRFYKTYDDIKESGYYENLRTLKRILDKPERSSEERERHMLAHGSQGEEDTTVEPIELLEMWDSEGMTVVAARSVVIREQENPFWHARKPFIAIKDSVVPHEFYGKGEIEPVLKLQHALNTIQNQVIDNRTQILMNMWRVTGENVDESELVYRPNGVIHLSNEFEKVEPIVPPDLTKNAQNDVSIIKADIQQALGIYDYTKGAETGANKTATGISLIQEAANARFNHKIQLLDEALRELGEIIFALYQQFITDEKIIRVAGKKGEEFVKVIPAEIAGMYDCVPEKSSTTPVNKMREREEIMNLYALFAQEPYENLKLELKKEILRRFDVEHLEDAMEQDIEEWTQRMQQEQEQQQEQAAQLEAAQAQMMEEEAPLIEAPPEGEAALV